MRAGNPQSSKELPVGTVSTPAVRSLSVGLVSVDLVGRPTVDLLRTDSALCR